jgi:hypothetical protein
VNKYAAPFIERSTTPTLVELQDNRKMNKSILRLDPENGKSGER